MQGYPLAMVTYGVEVLPPIKNLKAAHPDITQPWYAEDVGALGTYYNIELYFNSKKHSGLGHGYYPKPSKSVLIVQPDNLKTGKQFGLHHRFKV